MIRDLYFKKIKTAYLLSLLLSLVVFGYQDLQAADNEIYKGKSVTVMTDPETGNLRYIYLDGDLLTWTDDDKLRLSFFPITFLNHDINKGAILGFYGYSQIDAFRHYGAKKIYAFEKNLELINAAKLFSGFTPDYFEGDDLLIKQGSIDDFLESDSYNQLDYIAVEGRYTEINPKLLERLKSKLSDQGAVSIRLALGGYSKDDLLRIISYFAESFESLTLWYSNILPVRSDIILIGFKKKTDYDIVTVKKKSTYSSLAFLEGNDFYSLLSFYIGGRSNFEKALANLKSNDAKGSVKYTPAYNEAGYNRSTDNFFFFSKYRSLSSKLFKKISLEDKKNIGRYFKARSLMIKAKKIATTTGYIKDEEKEFAKARKIVKNEPYIALFYFNTGAAYYRSELVQMAIPYLEKAKDINPNNPATRHLLGLSYEKVLEYAKANKEFAALRKLDPDFSAVNVKNPTPGSPNYCAISDNNKKVQKKNEAVRK